MTDYSMSMFATKDEMIGQMRAEIARLREALADYACPGLASCRSIKLKDGTCIDMLTGQCGNAAREALEIGWDAQPSQ